MRRDLSMAVLLAATGITVCAMTLAFSTEGKAASPSPAPGDTKTTAPTGQPPVGRVRPTPPPKPVEISAQHKLLSSLAGHWTGSLHVMEPAAENNTTTNNNTNNKETPVTVDGKLEFDGLFAEWRQTGTVDGRPYEGRILFGFDDITRRYTAIAMANTSPAFISYTGTYDAAKKQLHLEAHYSDQVTHRFDVGKLLIAFIDNDTIVVDEFMSHAANAPDVHTRSTTYKKS